MIPQPILNSERSNATEPPALVQSIPEALRAGIPSMGAKSWNVAWLDQQGYRVPPWRVLTAHACGVLLRQDGLDRLIERTLSNLPETRDKRRAVLREIRAKIEALSMPRSLRASLRTAVDDLTEEAGSPYLAVRSSMVGEDAPEASFAGQMDSFLFCRGMQEVEEAVFGCLASAFSDRAVQYRLERGLPLTEIRAAVLIQVMVSSDPSGVLFTANPNSGCRHEALIAACWGLGEGVVAGQCAADEFTVDLRSGTAEQEVREKDTQRVVDRCGGTREAPVPPEKRERPCLTTPQVRELARLGRAIAAKKKRPQDIEWTLRNGKIYLLQTRPVTELPPPPDDAPAVWDNSNIQESYCGVTTPLTFSFARRAYATVYEQTMEVLNIPRSVIEAHRPVLENMLGLIKGRIYYNINNWYRALSLLPSFKTNKEDMERMMGLSDPVDFVEDCPQSLTAKIKRAPRLLGALANLFYQFSRLDTRVEPFFEHFRNEYSRIDRGLLHTKNLAELVELTRHLRRTVLQRWSTPIINDFFVMMMNGRVYRALERLDISDPEQLKNDLLAGQRGLESVQLLKLCRDVRGSKPLTKLFDTTEADRLMEALRRLHPEFYERCQAYIERYGDRCMGELKLETITPRQNPSFMFTCMKNFLHRPALTADTLSRREEQRKQRAEHRVSTGLRRQGALGGLRWWKFKRDLRRLRQGIQYRERMRMTRTRLFGLYRSIYLEMGRQLHQYKQLDDPRNLFFLTVDELEQYVEGRSVQTDLKALCAARQQEYAEYETDELPHHFRTGPAPYLKDTYRYPYQETDADQNEHTFQGTGCYSGVVEAEVKLIFSPDDELSLDGQILCTVRTDPGWAPLFPTVGGLIVERGSTLSHSAIVARELGIPAVVGVPNITKHLTSGDRVRLDGSTGTVEIL